MGKGDIKTKKGKRHIGSFGKHRPHKSKKSALLTGGEKEKRPANKEGQE